MQRTFGAVQYSLKPQRINTLHILHILPILHFPPTVRCFGFAQHDNCVLPLRLGAD